MFQRGQVHISLRSALPHRFSSMCPPDFLGWVRLTPLNEGQLESFLTGHSPNEPLSLSQITQAAVLGLQVRRWWSHQCSPASHSSWTQNSSNTMLSHWNAGSRRSFPVLSANQRFALNIGFVGIWNLLSASISLFHTLSYACIALGPTWLRADLSYLSALGLGQQ